MVRKKIVNWQSLATVGFHADGLASFVGEPNLMPAPHRHNEIEFNFLDVGEMTYIFGGRPVTVGAGVLHVFWAGLPHQVVGIRPGTRLKWVTVPLHSCLEWNLPRAFLKDLLFSKMLVETDPTEGPWDQALLQRWHHDLSAGSAPIRQALLLEIQGRLRRLAASLGGGPAEAPSLTALKPGGGMRELGTMLLYIHENFRRALQVQDIARAADLRPNYAMRLFRGVFGGSLMAYVTQLRVTHAQRLLRLSNAKVIDIAHDSGFGSLSNFYEIFERTCGRTPGAYRREPGTDGILR